ncbi:hypothetical protein [Dapis sp. BLCC M229]|uniref:hypothetical protein n=1 Tax=Dapis sp. BLCC M229 TaxID=3400188 RepID=UPI003CF2A70B
MTAPIHCYSLKITRQIIHRKVQFYSGGKLITKTELLGIVISENFSDSSINNGKRTPLPQQSKQIIGETNHDYME